MYCLVGLLLSINIIYIYIYIYIYIKGGGVWVYLSGDPWVRDRFILVVRECIWNALLDLLGLPIFDVIDSLGYPPPRLVYQPSSSTLVTASRFGEG